MADRNFIDQIRDTLNELGGEQNIHLKNADINCTPQNEYVSKRTISKIDDILDDGEKVYFLAKEGGSGGFDELAAPVTILSNGQKETKRNNKGSVRLAATDRRVVCKIPQSFSSDEQISIPYHSISTVNIKSGITRTRISLQTDAATYKIDIGYLGSDECEQMAKFIREKVAESQTQSNSSDDPLDKLERLQNLKNDGVISEKEFDEKKEELLDQI